MIGQQLKDRYQVREELGRGGMAIVYRARDAVLKRDVAVKVLHAHLADRPEARRRLRREALAAAKLSHDNILKVFDFSGEDETGPAILVTEYVRGKTLKALYEEEKDLPCEVAAMIGVVLADALAHAHRNGIVHRDIKPENVMFRTEDGALKLMDFGIAKLFEEQSVTQTSALLGSPAHMAPESLDGKPADFQSDIYSLGTVLYLFAAQKYPFWEDTAHALLRRVAQGKFQDPEAVRPAVGRRLNRIIKEAMALKPEERYPNAESLAEALRAFLAEVGIDEPDAALRALLLDVKSEAPRLKEQVVKTLVARAGEALRQRRKGAVLAHLNRVLAYDPKNQAAADMLRSLERREKSVYAAAFVGLTLLGLGSAWAYDKAFRGEARDKNPHTLVPYRADVVAESLPARTGPENPQTLPDGLALSLPASLSTSQPTSEPLAPEVTASPPATLPVVGKVDPLKPSTRPVPSPSPSPSPSTVKEPVVAAVPRFLKLQVKAQFFMDAYVDGLLVGENKASQDGFGRSILR